MICVVSSLRWGSHGLEGMLTTVLEAATKPPYYHTGTWRDTSSPQESDCLTNEKAQLHIFKNYRDRAAKHPSMLE